MGFHAVAQDPFPCCPRCGKSRTLSQFAIPKAYRRERLPHDTRPGTVGERYEMCRVCRDVLGLPERILERISTEKPPKPPPTKEQMKTKSFLNKERKLYKQRQDDKSSEERRLLSRPYSFQTIGMSHYRRSL